jgi:trk system potassium uptake protein
MFPFRHKQPHESPSWLTPPKALVLGFIAIIAVGTVLLSLPAASADGQPLHWLDALFTATSALCVTGLAVVDTGTRFSLFGHVVILIYLQIGGVGFITMAVVISVFIGRRVGLRERLLLQEALGQVKVQGMVRLALYILGLALLAETLGFLLLWARWQVDFGVGQAAWYALFHSVSAFVNAGFDIFGQQGQASLQGYRGDVLVNVVVGGLIFLGSLGVPVLNEIINWRRNRRFTLHTLLVLSMSGILFFGGGLLLLLIELNSPYFVEQLPWGERLLVAFFHSASARTGGFSTVPLIELGASTWLVLMMLMFIGASTASMGGGVKVNVLGALVFTMWSVGRGREESEAFGRTIPRETVYKALGIVLGAATYVMLVTILLTISEPMDPLYLMFEVISAFGTVGYSLGVTPDLSAAGKWMIIVTMFVGRLGPLTLIAALARTPSPQHVRYPEEKIMIG